MRPENVVRPFDASDLSDKIQYQEFDEAGEPIKDAVGSAQYVQQTPSEGDD